jgi:diacylglycerol kinase family enzyme
VLLIANPHSGGGRARKKLGHVLSELKHRGIRHELTFVRTLDEAATLSRRANLDGRRFIVAVGGDGTINRVINGFFDRDGKRLSDALLGIVHLGSSPDFCRSYGIPTSIPAAVQALSDGQSRPVRVGKVSFENQSSAFFGCCANAGLGAEVARFANSGIRRRFGDLLGTFLSLLRALHNLSPRMVRLEIDGIAKQLLSVNLAIGRTRYVASGLKVNHALDDLDPRLYVLALKDFSWRRLGHIVLVLYGGRSFAGSPCFTLKYAHSVRLTPLDGPMELEFDGDPGGWCPCTIQTAPDMLQVLTKANDA